MLENRMRKDEFDDEGELYLNLNDLIDLRESAEFKEASDAFEYYLENYAVATRMQQSVLTDICHLAARATRKAMEYCFTKGFEIGSNVMKSAQEEKATEAEKPDIADILDVSLGDEGYLSIPRETRELCAPLVKAADALERALGDLPVDEADKNRIARLSAELMAQAEQYAVELGIQAYLEFTRTLSPEMNAELEGYKDNEVPET